MLLACFIASRSMGADESPKTDKAKKPLPADFPAFEDFRQQPLLLFGENLPPNASIFDFLLSLNRSLIQSLDDYTTESISREFGRRMEKEKEMNMKLLVAMIAAKSGNAEAAKFIQDAVGNLDYEVTRSRLGALRWLVSADSRDWVFDDIYKALKDTRNVTGIEQNQVVVTAVEAKNPGEPVQVLFLASEDQYLFNALGYAGNRKVVPFLIEMAGRPEYHDHPIEALATLNDPRAIPAVLKCLQKQDAAIRANKKGGYPSRTVVEAAGTFKIKEAVPVLLRYLDSSIGVDSNDPNVIRSLGEIGDPRAIVPLKKVVETQGIDPADPKREVNAERVLVAKMALIKLEPEDPYPKWFALLEDNSVDWVYKCEILCELAQKPNPRAIPHIVTAIKADQGDASFGVDVIARDGISALGNHRYKAAVEALIECLDFKFKEVAASKSGTTPRELIADIGDSLKKITGQDFGADKAQWVKWWNDEGKNLAGLK